MQKPKFKRLKKACSPLLLLQPNDRDDAASTADSYNNQSAEFIGSNDDLLTEILIRLPAAKSFFRFKSISKHWQSLLTHPRFTTLLFDKLLKPSGLYYHELHVSYDVQNPTTPPIRGLDFSPDPINGIRIVQSCNGLLLCCCDKEDGCSSNYYVCNPTTKKVEAIPLINGSDWNQLWSFRLMGLAYHPTECVHYKLVCIFRTEDRPYYKYKIQIYSSKTGRWKKLRQTFTHGQYTEFRYGVYWNGAFYWAPSYHNPKYLRLDTEKLQDLPLPSKQIKSVFGNCYHIYSAMPFYFGESRGHLHLVDTADDYKNNPLRFNVYEMLRDHSGWFVKYQVDLHELSAAYPNMTYKYKWESDKYVFSVLDIVRGEEEEDAFMVVKAVDDIKRYNIQDKSFIQLFRVPDNIEGFKGNGTRTFKKMVHRFVGHRYMEKIGASDTTDVCIW